MYKRQSENITDYDSFNVSGGCAENYSGKFKSTICTVTGDYELTGCDPIVCKSPDDKSGYIVTETELDTTQTFEVDARCDGPFWKGTAVAEKCMNNDDEYKLTGCDPIKCRTPSNTDGYVVESEHELRPALGFSVDARCAGSYEGLARAEKCMKNDDEYKLTGCDPIESIPTPGNNSAHPPTGNKGGNNSAHPPTGNKGCCMAQPGSGG